jgi:hypothetical protein
MDIHCNNMETYALDNVTWLVINQYTLIECWPNGKYMQVKIYY